MRAAREHLQLSLADVANGHYSTSLISQIERNKVEPSEECLRFLAERLKLSFAELETLAQQQRTAWIETNSDKSYNDLHMQASQLLANKDISKAIDLLKNLYFPQIPAPERWRLAALRGQCYFAQRHFLKAQQDFLYAISEKPALNDLPIDQQHNFMLLHLHLASTHRELQQFDDALGHYQTTLQMMNHDTPFGYVAEAHWGMALITFVQANSLRQQFCFTQEDVACKEKKLRAALKHGENARSLYRAIGEQLRATTVTCQIARIEQALGEGEKVRSSLEEALATWLHILDEPPASTPQEKQRQQEQAGIVSAAACSLASIELEAKNYQAANAYVHQALQAAMRSYTLRRVDAYLMQGRILETIDPYNPATEEAFRRATEELANTERIAARVGAHMSLGRLLLKIGKLEESEQELEQARLLLDLISASSPANLAEDIF
jgi:tetratricopeptide (TPR) repeat protein